MHPSHRRQRRTLVSLSAVATVALAACGLTDAPDQAAPVVDASFASSGDPGWDDPPTHPDSNQPENWEEWAADNGETWECDKIEDPDVELIGGLAWYTMPDPDEGYVWRLLKIKAGTVDTLYWDPVAGEQYASDRDSISHVILCQMLAPEQLSVSKTADTSFNRTHDWTIEKTVDPATLWLFMDGTGDGTVWWHVDVTYEGYDDGDWNVSGEITIENTGEIDATITEVIDKLGGEEIDVDCEEELPFNLEPGETLTCTYDEDGLVEGKNEVQVKTERATYDADADIVWGDPDEELHATVEVTDISDLFGEELLGTLDAADFEEGEDKRFSYYKSFAWADYGEEGCGSFDYENTAEVVGDEDTVLDDDDATLTVHVQCLLGDETAWAANGVLAGELRYTHQGNWATYVAYAEKTTTLFAGQHIDVGTVTFSAVAEDRVTITVTLVGWAFSDVAENLKVQDYASAPSGNPAPGLFEHKKTCDVESPTCEIVVPANNYYGVHVNVGGEPDPDFGPGDP